MAKVKDNLRPLSDPRSWARTHGTYLSGQAAIDGADAAAIANELKWGMGRLRLLVPTELREKFDRQRYLLNAAIWHGDLEAVRRESERMVRAWIALDGAAEAAGALKLDPAVWEGLLADGTVVALVRTPEEAHAVVREGRAVVVYTMAEITRMLDNYRAVVDVKEAWPGATVSVVRRQQISDPLDLIRDGNSLETPFDGILDEQVPDFTL